MHSEAKSVFLCIFIAEATIFIIFQAKSLFEIELDQQLRLDLTHMSFNVPFTLSWGFSWVITIN